MWICSYIYDELLTLYQIYIFLRWWVIAVVLWNRCMGMGSCVAQAMRWWPSSFGSFENCELKDLAFGKKFFWKESCKSLHWAACKTLPYHLHALGWEKKYLILQLTFNSTRWHYTACNVSRVKHHSHYFAYKIMSVEFLISTFYNI